MTLAADPAYRPVDASRAAPRQRDRCSPSCVDCTGPTCATVPSTVPLTPSTSTLGRLSDLDRGHLRAVERGLRPRRHFVPMMVMISVLEFALTVSPDGDADRDDRAVDRAGQRGGFERLLGLGQVRLARVDGGLVRRDLVGRVGVGREPPLPWPLFRARGRAVGVRRGCPTRPVPVLPVVPVLPELPVTRSVLRRWHAALRRIRSFSGRARRRRTTRRRVPGPVPSRPWRPWSGPWRPLLVRGDRLQRRLAGGLTGRRAGVGAGAVPLGLRRGPPPPSAGPSTAWTRPGSAWSGPAVTIGFGPPP